MTTDVDKLCAFLKKAAQDSEIKSLQNALLLYTSVQVVRDLDAVFLLRDKLTNRYNLLFQLAKQNGEI